MSPNGHRYNVGGILLERPFKIRRLGHFGFNVDEAGRGAASSTATCSASRSPTRPISRARRGSRRMPGLGDTPRLFHALRHRPPRVGAVLEAGDGPPRRPQIRARGDDQPDHLAVRQPQGDRRRPQLFRGAAGAASSASGATCRAATGTPMSTTPTATPTSSITASSRSAGTSDRSRATMYYRGFQREAGAAADVGGRRDRRGAGKGHRHLFRPPPGAAERRRDLRCRRRAAAAAVQDHQDRPGAPVRRRCRSRRSASTRSASRLHQQRGEPSTAARAASSCAAAPSITRSRSIPKELRGVARPQPRTRPACRSASSWRATRSCARRSHFLKAQRLHACRPIPPELYPGIDYAAFALDPDGHCIQLYYYMEQIGWDGRVRPAAERRKVNGELARGAGAALRHLRRPGLPGPARLAHQRRAPAKAGAHLSAALTLDR